MSELAKRICKILREWNPLMHPNWEEDACGVIDAAIAPVLAENERLKADAKELLISRDTHVCDNAALRQRVVELENRVAELKADDKRRQLVAWVYRLALVSIAKDESLECHCGSDLYTDGEECPKCTALSASETPIDAALNEPSHDA